MENHLKTKNRGIWFGTVITAPELDHELYDRESGEVVKRYYLLTLQVEYVNEKGSIRDTSHLPVLISENKLSRLSDPIKPGNSLFIKGEWRVFAKKEESGRSRVVPRIQATLVERPELPMRTRNKIEFVGTLATKLYKAQFDEQGKMKVNEKNKPLPFLDDNGEKIPWVRRNHEGFTVNDFHIEIKGLRRERTGEVMGVKYKEFIPCIGYGGVAWKVAKEVDIGTLVRATGYIRQRTKPGTTDHVYEAVITDISPM